MAGDGDSLLGWAARWNRPPLQAYFDQQSHRFTAEVDDPPPLEAEFRGRTYYLAHFNARRAWYSSESPPREPAGDDL